MKHGRGLEVNQDMFGDDDQTGQKAYAAAGVAITKGYATAQPKASKAQRMMYSSVGDEERRRANAIQEERANLDYKAFDNNDVTATMNDIDGDNLGAT